MPLRISPIGKKLDAVVGDVAGQGLQLKTRLFIRHRVDAQRLTLGRDVVVGHGEGAIGPAHLAAGRAKPGEGLRGGDLMDEVQVDIEDRFAVLFVDDVSVPDLVVEGLWCVGHDTRASRP
jgi:hypothetical protein